ncbi:MAG: hypothetical protein JOZ40_09460 [Methylobacteriaceae bacterium]|nr:hypothetical protein [Methylobacteriaceae bacterium]
MGTEAAGIRRGDDRSLREAHRAPGAASLMQLAEVRAAIDFDMAMPKSNVAQ